jgi:hypothetical protein
VLIILSTPAHQNIVSVRGYLIVRHFFLFVTRFDLALALALC